ncbi:LolA family protein [Neisseria sp. CCUG12390]|uniref:LolA family protein n=1 Tax=Neisseria sp. CCUG12390 TaxID=3392035 RepID=UPI003A0FF483
MRKLFLSAVLTLASPVLWAFSAEELAKTLQKPANIQGTFTQQRHLKSLEKPMTTGGKFVLVPKRGLLWQMQKPFAATLRVRSDGIMQWNGKSWTAAQSGRMSGQTRQIRLFLDLLGGNTQGLQKQFDLKLSGTAQKWTLQLLPKTPVMKQVFHKIELNGDQLVRKIELHEKQGDRTVMQFDGIRTNQPLETFVQQSL